MGQTLVERGARLLPLVGAGLPLDERCERHGCTAVPVIVETARQLAHHRPDGEQVEVREVGLGAAVEVLVAEIASADDRDRVVGHPQLVVHAAVKPLGIAQELEQASDSGLAAGHEWIEQPRLDARNQGRRATYEIAICGMDIVEQDAHSYTAFGGRGYALQQQVGRAVVADAVVLQVERPFGGIGERGPRLQGLRAGVDDLHSRQRRVRRAFGREGASETSLRRLLQGVRDWTGDVEPHARASACGHERERRKDEPERWRPTPRSVTFGRCLQRAPSGLPSRLATERLRHQGSACYARLRRCHRVVLPGQRLLGAGDVIAVRAMLNPSRCHSSFRGGDG